jgi:quinol monooxygenase YgiN
MTMDRREFFAMAGAATLAGLTTTERGGAPMYGLIGKVSTVPGKRDEFAAILLEGTGGMPGCLSYVIATDPSDPDGLWITEVWENQASHQASLGLPAVQAAIARGRSLIAGFSNRVETVPLGGIGLAKSGS